MIAISTVLLQVYLVYGCIFILFLILGIKVLQRTRNRISVTLSMIFLIPALGILINILYRAVDNYAFNLIGNKLTIIFSCIGLTNILFFAKLIRRSKRSFTLKQQIIQSGVLFGLFLVLLIIPNGVEFEYNGIGGMTGYNQRSLDPLDLGVPVWSTAFFLYGTILSQVLAVWSIYIGRKQRLEMGTDSVFGKKYIQTLVGMLLMDIVILGTFIANWLNFDIGRQIHLIVSSCIIPSAIFLYLGLKQEKK